MAATTKGTIRRPTSIKRSFGQEGNESCFYSYDTSEVDREFCDILNQGGYDNPISLPSNLHLENRLAVSNNGGDQDLIFNFNSRGYWVTVYCLP